MENIRDNNGLPSESGNTVERLTRAEKKRNEAFYLARERLHKNHAVLNRTFSLQFVLILVCGIIAAFAIRQFVAEPTKVDGSSMSHTLENNERVLVEKVSYWFDEPKRGDIVIVHYPNVSSRYVKRVIALEGETIEIRNGYVYINGERLDESAYAGDWYGRIVSTVGTAGSVNGAFTVPAGHVFVIGDNRNRSNDSRSHEVGPIPNEQVLGRAVAVVWPFSSIRSVIP